MYTDPPHSTLKTPPRAGASRQLSRGGRTGCLYVAFYHI